MIVQVESRLNLRDHKNKRLINPIIFARNILWITGQRIGAGSVEIATAEIDASAHKSSFLTALRGEAKLGCCSRRSGRAAECAGLENRWARKGPVSSNLTSSAR